MGESGRNGTERHANGKYRHRDGGLSVQDRLGEDLKGEHEKQGKGETGQGEQVHNHSK